MKAKIAITNPNKIEATISLTMTLEQWQDLRKEMKDMPFYGATQALRGSIDELVEKSRANFHVDTSDEEVAA